MVGQKLITYLAIDLSIVKLSSNVALSLLNVTWFFIAMVLKISKVWHCIIFNFKSKWW